MCAYGNFRVLDVTDPALVFWLGEFPAECNGPMKVIGNTAYLGVGSCSDIGCSGLGFTILDVSNPVQIIWKGTLDGLVPSSLAVEGTLVYLFYGG
jgi:hypothetical protein